MIDIHFKIDQPGAVLLKIKSTNSAKEYIITDHKYIDKGYYRKRIRSKKLAGGVHSVTLVTAESSAVEKLVVDKNDVEK